MKALVITGSRADRNGLEVVNEALLKAGHESRMIPADGGTCNIIRSDTDVVIVGGDRIEVLESATWFARYHFRIAHIAGGDVTTGSADDRYRDAITALACIHFATNEKAFQRLRSLAHTNVSSNPTAPISDCLYLTGSPAIDRIKQTPVLSKDETFDAVGLPKIDMRPVALVCVHPNTSGKDAPEHEAWVTRIALSKLGILAICLGANADYGQDDVNRVWFDAFKHKFLAGTFIKNVSPQLYYSLMTHCDFMVGNSSAMLYEAPSFGLPCVLVGDRQTGRVLPGNVTRANNDVDSVLQAIKLQFGYGRYGRYQCENPYGDGNSAPRIVRALEENEWRWKRD